MNLEEIMEWCSHYREWKDICYGIKTGGWIGGIGSVQEWQDYTHDAVYIRELARLYVRIIEESCENTDILLVVTEGIPPEYLGVSIKVVLKTYAIIETKLKDIRR